MIDKKNSTRRNFIKYLGAGISGAAMFPSPSYAPLYNPNVTELVQFIEGDLPILITAPHGGNELVFGIPARANIARPVPNFTFSGVVWTYEICLSIRRTLQRLSGGKSPYMVLNLAHRRYLDVNREDSNAYEVTLNAPRIYWEYHDNIREFINQMNIIYENPIMIEVTGHNDTPNLIVKRTLNGKAVERMVQKNGIKNIERKLQDTQQKINDLPSGDKKTQAKNYFDAQKDKVMNDPKMLQKYGHDIYTGTKSIIGEIENRGYTIDPELNVPDIEMPQTKAGDFTLNRYGSHQEIGGIDAIQLVVGGSYRKAKNYQQTGRDIGNAIWSFIRNYDLYAS